MERIYLPGLNGLRAMAASAVVISHINLNLTEFGLPKGSGLSAANFGVTIFFTLSGFLITYLLLIERSQSGTIKIGQFYARRLLRIWPLYFLYMVVVLMFNGIVSIDGRVFWYLLFLPNVAFVIRESIPLLTHYWSLGVEEQFYLVWPVIVKRVNRIALILVVFVFSFLVLKVALKLLDFPRTSAFFHYSRFGCMAIGALTGIAYHRKSAVIHHLRRPAFQWLCWLALMFVVIDRFHIASIIDHELISIATAVIILSVVDKTSVIDIDRPFLNYLGRISYGMYVLNPLLIAFSARLFGYLSGLPDALMYVLIYTLVPLLVVGVSHLSYRYFESIFLRWKERFAVVKT